MFKAQGHRLHCILLSAVFCHFQQKLQSFYYHDTRVLLVQPTLCMSHTTRKTRPLLSAPGTVLSHKAFVATPPGGHEVRTMLAMSKPDVMAMGGKEGGRVVRSTSDGLFDKFLFFVHFFPEERTVMRLGGSAGVGQGPK